jgi:hypothetical protein
VSLPNGIDGAGVMVNQVLGDPASKVVGWLDSLPRELSKKLEQPNPIGLNSEMRLGTNGQLEEVKGINRLNYQTAVAAMDPKMLVSQFEAMPAKEAAKLLDRALKENNTNTEEAIKQLGSTYWPPSRNSLDSKISELSDVNATLRDLRSLVGASLAQEVALAQTRATTTAETQPSPTVRVTSATLGEVRDNTAGQNTMRAEPSTKPAMDATREVGKPQTYAMADVKIDPQAPASSVSGPKMANLGAAGGIA